MNQSAYGKPFKTIREQRELLESRGMTVPDAAAAERWLDSVGYYRLSGYWYPFRVRSQRANSAPVIEDRFQPGTSFQQILDLYEFDRILKLLVLDAIERIEVAMRVRVGHTLGRHGAFAHTDPNVLSTEFVGVADPSRPPAHAGWLDSAHAKWLRKVGQEQDRSKEEFVKHFKRKYGGPLPVWVVTEILDFGGLSRLYEGLKQRDRDDIAASFDLKDNSGAGHGAALVSWMKNLNYIRNTCAHHSRLWNRNIDVQLSYRHLSAIADLQHAASPATTKRVYASLAVLAYLLNHVSPGSSWTTDVLGHIRSGLAAMNRSEAEMGCPPGWVNEILWA
ncbi:Abi family protein [Rhodococcus sp. NPDC127530]|uniref:Abi family protein n=1 Tax=unclassified Rhodococcus (in: high G+C Gram-positive bacteria) TaxID=192944 RepID=UPI0036430CB7